MLYDIYQIILSEQDRDEINSMPNPHKDHPKFSARMAAMHDEDISAAKGYFEKVAVIEANDLEHVFEISNIGPANKVTKLTRRMHSLSVGDVVVDGNGDQYAVADFGFNEVQDVV